MKIAIQLIRVIVGVLFIFSGLIKANDPLGLAYKMEEYFAVWGWHWASNYSLYLSIGMNVLEIVAGIALLLGWASHLITRLLLVLIVFFTFLTGYAVVTGSPKTCGCFGDCLPLKAWQSFAKDILLLALCWLLYKYRHYVKAFLPLRANLFLVLLATGTAFWGQLYILKNLPFVDCLPYAAGKDLLQQMQPPPGSVPDSTTVMFVYKKDGKEVSFDAASFPDDFDEQTYTFVKRNEVLVRKGTGQAAIQDFAFFGADGQDTTKPILNTEGRYLLFFAKDFEGKLPAWQEVFGKIYLKTREKKLPLLVVTNQPQIAQQWFNQTNHFNVPILTADGTVMKTMLRAKTGMVAMQQARVQQKWSEANLNEVIKWLNQ